MPDASKTVELPPTGYDPARADHIRELVEAMRDPDDPKERERLAEELALFIFGSSH